MFLVCISFLSLHIYHNHYPPILILLPQGDTWSLPYSLGPPHMEKDKNESNVACFDCCYHPAAIGQMGINKRFRDSLVITAIEGVEEAYRRQKQDVSN